MRTVLVCRSKICPSREHKSALQHLYRYKGINGLFHRCEIFAPRAYCLMTTTSYNKAQGGGFAAMSQEAMSCKLNPGLLDTRFTTPEIRTLCIDINHGEIRAVTVCIDCFRGVSHLHLIAKLVVSGHYEPFKRNPKYIPTDGRVIKISTIIRNVPGW